MRAYVLTTGIVFGLLVVIHVWRVFEEGSSIGRSPHFIGLTLIAAALSAWAFRLYAKSARSSGPS